MGNGPGGYYTIKAGENLGDIAAKYGVAVGTVWFHAKNKSLRQNVEAPGKLLPGARVWIPGMPAAVPNKVPSKSGGKTKMVKESPRGLLEVTVQDDAGKPIKGAIVQIVGIGWGVGSDKDGVANFGKVLPDTYGMSVTKPGYGPKAGKPAGPVTGSVTVKAKATGKLTLKMVAVAWVTKFTAKLPTTQSARGTNSIAPADTHHTFTSSSEQKGMGANAPTVLIRNCGEIELTADTNLPNQKGIVWAVEPNPGPAKTAPQIVIKKDKIVLTTDTSGGYAVTASLGGKTIRWNIVVAGVVIKSSKVLRNSRNFKDESESEQFSVSSGKFEIDRPSKCGMYVKAKVELSAGNESSLNSHLDKVHMGIVNILLNNTAQAEYAGGGRERERIPTVAGLPDPVVDPATVIVDVGYPTLDTGFRPPAVGGGKIFLTKTRSTPATGVKRVIESCDSPAVGFTSHLMEFNAAPTKKIQSNSGVNAFKIYLVGYSDDANYTYVAFGHAEWTADYSGTVTVGAWGTTPVWRKRGAKISGRGRKLTVIKNGKEAKTASCETRPPVYLSYIIDAR
ncbi:MAG: LysM peptidoglycan-binding domain-containing protein [candidate division Zixibacteria bacterium]|nr:LysM peptidoglycan-binding domain-containing protein [candidate division Zixibacteria bacterium]